MLFSLDIFEMKLDLWGTIIGLFMHNIPALILLIVLIISWEHEIVGAAAFIFAGLLYMGVLLTSIITTQPAPWYQLFSALQISGPAFLIGYLFLIGWLRKREITQIV
jgi:hypothetical protein